MLGQETNGSFTRLDRSCNVLLDRMARYEVAQVIADPVTARLEPTNQIVGVSHVIVGMTTQEHVVDEMWLVDAVVAFKRMNRPPFI